MYRFWGVQVHSERSLMHIPPAVSMNWVFGQDGKFKWLDVGDASGPVPEGGHL